MSLAVEKDTFSNKNLGTGSFVELASFTASGAKLIIARVRFDLLAGDNEEYEARLSITPNGGSDRELIGAPWSMTDAAEGRYVHTCQLYLEDGDVLKVYAKNLSESGDAAVAGEVCWVDVTPWQGWATAEKQQIRDSLGVDGDKTTATGGQVQAVKTKTDTIGSANMTVTSPVTEDGDVEIVAGDGYETSGGNGPLTFTVTDYAGPDLTDATAEFLLLEKSTYDGDATSEGAATGTVAISVDGTTITYTISLTAAETAALAPSPPADKYNYVYQLRVTPVAGEKFTPALGALQVKRQVGG